MVKEGIPFVLATLIIAGFFAALYYFFGGVIPVIGIVLFCFLAIFMAYFFRDPQRTMPTEADIIVSAADGRVTRVEDREEGKFVSVFLSPLDVHINRAPIAGKVLKVDYVKGKKNPATSDRASLINERNSLTIEGVKMNRRAPHCVLEQNRR